MFSFDGNELPIWVLAGIFLITIIGYLASGILSEWTWRNRALKNLEISSKLKQIGSPSALAAAEDCEKNAIKSIDAHSNKTNAASLAFGMLIRGVPYFVLIMFIWLMIQLYDIAVGSFEIKNCVVSFVYWTVFAFAAEGIASVFGQFVTPLSKRWKRVPAQGRTKREEHPKDDPNDDEK